MPRNLYHNETAQWLVYIGVFVVLGLIPLLVGNLFTLNLFARYAALAMLALSVSVVWGFGGILSLGQGIAFGLGAYGMGMTMQMQFQDKATDPIPNFMLTNGLTELPLYWEPFWSTSIGLTLSLVVPAVFCLIFGMLMFQARVAGVFVAIMTLAMLAALYSMSYDAQAYTSGFNGITPPNAFEIGGAVIAPYSVSSYWVCVAILAALTMGLKLILQSNFGLIVKAIRDDAQRVRFLGYNVAAYQTVIFTLSGIVAAFAGICWVMVVGFVSPTAFEMTLSISAVVWAAVGGRLSLLGAIIGAVLINGMQSYLGDGLQELWTIVLGAIFIGVVLFMPRGITGLIEHILAWRGWSGNFRTQTTTRYKE